ncbi:IS3 family transposase [Streptomyces sp. PTD5-9]|uniref:IS3 family transposase n=1 Tax=Streptomyces sp. PTD5-9 TaxID=3120150 RepID=UPI00300928B4
MKHYRPGFKADAVALYESRPEATIKQIAADLGVDPETLRNGIRAAGAGRPRGRRAAKPPTVPVAPSALEAEVAALRREDAELKKEREILRKAARSSFYAWLTAAKARTVRKAADEALAHEITVIHVASRGTCGVPRVHAELRRPGRRVNRERIARLMRDHGIQGAHRRGRRSLTRPDKKARLAPDLIGRDFHAETPGTKLVGDITYLPTGEGRL